MSSALNSSGLIKCHGILFWQNNIPVPWIRKKKKQITLFDSLENITYLVIVLYFSVAYVSIITLINKNLSDNVSEGMPKI